MAIIIHEVGEDWHLYKELVVICDSCDQKNPQVFGEDEGYELEGELIQDARKEGWFIGDLGDACCPTCLKE